jgi:hypothetical protein
MEAGGGWRSDSGGLAGALGWAAPWSSGRDAGPARTGRTASGDPDPGTPRGSAAAPRRGASRAEISRRFGLDPRTARRFANASTVDELLANTRRDGLIDQLTAYLNQRFNDGCTDAGVLFEEIRQLGFNRLLPATQDEHQDDTDGEHGDSGNSPFWVGRVRA